MSSSRRPPASSTSRGERRADGGVVGDAGVEHVQRGDPGGVRLDLAEPLGPDALDPHPIDAAAPLELDQLGAFVLVHRDDDLAADLVRDAARPAVLDHRHASRRAESRLLRTRRVVDAGVDHTRVAAGLVPGGCVLLLGDRDRATRVSLLDRARGREPDDAGSHHEDVNLLHIAGHSRTPGPDGSRPAAAELRQLTSWARFDARASAASVVSNGASMASANAT